jgi:hypothetical protein
MSQEQKKPIFEFNADEYAITINVTPTADEPFYTTHIVRKPTFDELQKREEKLVHEYREVAKREEEVDINDEAANAYLYDQIIRAVEHYDLGDGADPAERREVGEDLRALIPVAHKAAVVKGLYFGTARIETDPAMKGFRLGGVRELRVRQEIGPREQVAPVVHVLREPGESERAKYRNQSTQLRAVKGSRQSRSKIVQKLRPAVELYDALIVRVEGATVGGRTFDEAGREQFVAQIDALWKRQAVETVLASFEAELRD